MIGAKLTLQPGTWFNFNNFGKAPDDSKIREPFQVLQVTQDDPEAILPLLCDKIYRVKNAAGKEFVYEVRLLTSPLPDVIHSVAGNHFKFEFPKHYDIEIPEETGQNLMDIDIAF